MNNNDYQDECARTETDDYGPVLERLTVEQIEHARSAIAASAKNGIAADEIKKNLFYGRPFDQVEPGPLTGYQLGVGAANLEKLEPAKVRLLHHTLGLAGECGEIVNLTGDHLFGGKPLDKTKVMEECGDLLWYMAGLLDTVGLDFGVTMERNIAKLRARYPQKFGLEQGSDERDDKAERAALEGQ